MPDTNEQLRKRIQQLIPINELPANLQTKLLECAQVLNVKKSRFLFKQGDKDDYSYYLLEGEVELYANGQLDSVIDSNSDRAKYALAQLQPRQFSVKVKTEIKILLVERNKFDQLMLLAQESTLDFVSPLGGSIEVDIVDGDNDDADWMTQMLQSELFSRMPMPNIHQLFALLEPIEKKAGEVVISQGDPGEHYYIISEGKCIVSRKPSAKSKDIKLAELKSGDSFGEEALISDSTCNATVTMKTDGVLMQLSKDIFVELIKNPTLQALNFADAEALIDRGGVWLDVRYAEEHKESSIDGSINISLNVLRLKFNELDASKQYILYCDTGGRSSTGTFLLAERGFSVSYLDGGLVNNPEAVGIPTVAPEVSKPTEAGIKKKDIDANVHVEVLNIELETTEIKMKVAEDLKDDTDAKKKKEYVEIQKKLLVAKKKIEARKKIAEAEAEKKIKEEEMKFKNLKEESEKQMQQEKKKLEEIYNKNAKDMEKLEKAKEKAKEAIRKKRENLEKEASVAKKKLKEAERIKQEVETLKKDLEIEAERIEQEVEAREKKIQNKVKAEIEEGRKKLAEQYKRNSKEVEELQKEKAAVEAVGVAAKEEAGKIIQEYKAAHKKTCAEEEKLKAEHLKLKEEAKKIQETMKLIKHAKQETERIKQDALAEAKVLKEKQMDATSTKEERARLETKIKAVKGKVVEAERDIEDASHKEKVTESAQQDNEVSLVKKSGEEKAFQAQIENDLADFEDKQQETAASVTHVQMKANHMKRIMAKVAEAKANAASADINLLGDISRQLR